MRFCGTFKEGKIPYAEAEIVPYFLRFCELKGLSPFTVSLYKEKLDRFFRFLQGKTPVTSQDLLEFIGWLRERQPAPESQNIHLRSLKIFFRWAVAQSYLKKNPMHGVPMVRQRQKLITPLTISELQRLLDCARKTKQTGYRNTAIILLMVDTACWPGELCSLTLRDVRFEENLIRVDEKCGQRMLPISPSTRRALFTYLRRRKAFPREDAFFTTRHGTPLQVNNLQEIMDQLQRRTGIPRLYPYLLRHTAASSYLVGGADLETVRRLLGHTTYTITQRYVHLNQGDLARAQRRNSPVNQLR